MPRIVVTGAGGYIGSQLVKFLLQENNEVLAIDRYFFGLNVFDDTPVDSKLRIIRADCRNLNDSLFEDVHAVFDLAALSNDPSGDIDPNLTRQINFESRVRTAQLSKRCGVSRYILMSSCSVYGAGKELSLNEKSEVNPLTLYARSSLDAEVEVLSLNSNDFTVTVMRNATAFGLSKRMRFDLVINLMTVSAFENNEIQIRGGGNQLRPVIHVDDICEAAKTIGVADKHIISGEIFNVGMGNFSISQLAFMIRDILGYYISVRNIEDDLDKRSYDIDFQKASSRLNFKASRDIEFGVRQVYKALVNGEISKNSRTSTVNWYRRIIESQLLFDELNIDGKLL